VLTLVKEKLSAGILPSIALQKNYNLRPKRSDNRLQGELKNQIDK